MKSLTFKKTFKPFTRAVSPFFKVNSSPSATISAFELGSVVGISVGVVDVDVGEVGVGIRFGGVRWVNTKYPVIPATTIIPIITAIFINPFWFINLMKKFLLPFQNMVRADLFSGSLAVWNVRGGAARNFSHPPLKPREARQNSVRAIFRIHRQLGKCKFEEVSSRRETRRSHRI